MDKFILGIWSLLSVIMLTVGQSRDLAIPAVFVEYVRPVPVFILPKPALPPPKDGNLFGLIIFLITIGIFVRALFPPPPSPGSASQSESASDSTSASASDSASASASDSASDSVSDSASASQMDTTTRKPSTPPVVGVGR